ncbi:hypothetical protein EJ04DRAFT_555160 [Polyplosphaeria fusca]|uniref:Integral membrane protein n=1 Tax=Polyplosphaeria fusca TaxID=682080 RepID=A0A9P4QSY9_9PLEO|nr:hypothetical protein EJ04DRAFT_555160 [Polyplosphaeria fusca]
MHPSEALGNAQTTAQTSHGSSRSSTSPARPLSGDVSEVLQVSEPRSKRNRAFTAAREPLQHRRDLLLDAHRTRGPISFFNPTRAHFRPTNKSVNQTVLTTSDVPLRKSSKAGQPTSGVAYKWTSRNNRKGRHALAVTPTTPSSTYHTPPVTATLQQTLHGIRRMFTSFPIWDISYDVATIFTLGSIIWVINAFFFFLPLVQPATQFPNEALYGGGITAFIGATVFELGSLLLMAEAVNENRKGCFGWALERALTHGGPGDDGGEGSLRLRPSMPRCEHHHGNRGNLVGKGGATKQHASTADDAGTSSWVWVPSQQELRTHYMHDLGFLASFAQLLGASIFWISGLTALPGINDKMSPVVKIVFYWTPQVVGGTGFIVSGTLFMIETQSRWWKPAFGTLGWWIGAWNLVGGIGFTLCPAFGYSEQSWAQYQASLSTFWGSWAFLVGSVVQWYESLDKHPVEVDKFLGAREETE